MASWTAKFTSKSASSLSLNKFADLALLKIEDKDAPKFVPGRVR